MCQVWSTANCPGSASRSVTVSDVHHRGRGGDECMHLFSSGKYYLLYLDEARPAEKCTSRLKANFVGCTGVSTLQFYTEGGPY